MHVKYVCMLFSNHTLFMRENEISCLCMWNWGEGRVLFGIFNSLKLLLTKAILDNSWKHKLLSEVDHAGRRMLIYI